jgi:uncharacterized protein
MKYRIALTMAMALLTAVALTACLSSEKRATAESNFNPAQRNGKMKSVLVVTVTKGFRHDSIPLAEETIKMLGEKSGGWMTDFVRNDDEMKQKMTAEALKNYDAIIFANTTGVLPLPDPQGLLDYIKSGKGFVAMHSGSDTFHEWPGSSSGISAYVQMLGGEFKTHGAQCAIDGHILDPKHPAMTAVVKAGEKTAKAAADAVDLKKNTAATGKIWKAFDEIYILKNVDRANLHVLVSLPAHPNDGSKEAGTPGESLIAWCKAYGKGRVFYTSLGHRQEMWRDPLYQEHIIGGIKFAIGTAKGATKPNPEAAPVK